MVTQSNEDIHSGEYAPQVVEELRNLLRLVGMRGSMTVELQPPKVDEYESLNNLRTNTAKFLETFECGIVPNASIKPVEPVE